MSWPLGSDADFNLVPGQTLRKEHPLSVFTEPGAHFHATFRDGKVLTHNQTPDARLDFNTVNSRFFLRLSSRCSPKSSLWGFGADREAENASTCRWWCQHWLNLVYFAEIRQIRFAAATVLVPLSSQDHTCGCCSRLICHWTLPEL